MPILTNKKTGQVKTFVDRQHIADWLDAENEDAKDWDGVPADLPKALKDTDARPVSGPEGTSDVGQAEADRAAAQAHAAGKNPDPAEAEKGSHDVESKHAAATKSKASK